MSLRELIPPPLADYLPQDDLTLIGLAAVIAALPISVAYTYFRFVPQRNKSSRLNVLVIGASSGVGRSIALKYAARGDRVCITGRRSTELDAVKEECIKAAQGSRKGGKNVEENEMLAIVADFAKAEDMVTVRETIYKEWTRLDTVVIAAGVSALQPLMTVAGVENPRRNMTTVEGIQHAKDVARRALEGNYLGPLVSAVALIPLLTKSSPAPTIVLFSSAAAYIPAPTRTIYGSTKAAARVLFQSLAIENPHIHFTTFLPFTFEGNFRASAVDGGEVRESLKGTLKVDDVAAKCIWAADARKRTVWMPWWGGLAYALYLIWPSFVERKAMKKYNFQR